ncbi:MAG: 5-(carboxyamino)imidazole ribonucleotide synthase [Betaproteobacteria bacterium]
MVQVQPGDWLGLLGGGQLGRMFCMAAQSIGYKVCVLDPDADSPAGAVADDHLVNDYLDPVSLEWLAARCKAVTTEFENVPAHALESLAQRCLVAPAAPVVAIAQDRMAEKRFIASIGIAVAPHRVVVRADDLHEAPASLFPAILKTARLGYDGKGQVVVADAHEARHAFDRLAQVPCVLEQKLHLRQEVSCIVCRGQDGATATFPVAENEHRHGILAVSIVPARVLPEVERQARALATRIAQALDYVGVLCVEFFVLDDGRLVVNEIAPRPHNSGHYSIDACVTSQFEQQARILAGLPLGDTCAFGAAVMLNLLGELWFDGGTRREPPWAQLLRDPRARLHLYGKREPRPGRKMGHVTLVADSREHAIEQARHAAGVLRLPLPR